MGSSPPPPPHPRSADRAWATRALDGLRGTIPAAGSLTPNVRRLMLATVLSAAGLGAIGVVYNLYLVDLHYGLDMVGLLGAVSTVGAAGASLLVSTLLLRWTAREVMVAGTALVTVTLLAVTVLTSAPALLTLSLLSGAGLALAGNLVGLLLMEEGAAEQQAKLFSTYFALATGGATLGALLSTLVSSVAGALALAGGGDGALAHRLVLVAGSLVVGLSLPALIGLRPRAAEGRDRGGHQAANSEGQQRPNPGRDLAVILVSVACVAASLSLALPFLNVYFKQVIHASTSQIGVLFSVAAAVPTLTTFAGPYFVARIGKLPTFVLARLLSAPCILLLAWHLPLGLAAACVVGRNVLGSISGALDNNYMLEILPPWLRARASGWRAATFNGVAAVATYGGGLLVGVVGYPPLFVAGAVLTVLAMAIYYGYFRFVPVGIAPARAVPPLPHPGG